MTTPPLLRVLLVGFMGSGKTTVGKLVAEGLGWRFADFDDAIEDEAGAPISEIFATRGEAHFRALEARVAERLLEGREVVLASGGGWAAVPGRLEAAPHGTAVVWLRVSPGTAVRRASAGAPRRPLLEVADPAGAASELLERRVGYYERAHWSVDTEHSPVEDVSARILEILRTEYSTTSGA